MSVSGVMTLDPNIKIHHPMCNGEKSRNGVCDCTPSSVDELNPNPAPTDEVWTKLMIPTDDERLRALQAYVTKLETKIVALEASKNDNRSWIDGEVAGELVTLRATVLELNEALKVSTEKDKEWRTSYNNKVFENGTLKRLVEFHSNALKMANKALDAVCQVIGRQDG